MSFRFSSLYFTRNDAISYIFKTDNQQLLVNIDATYDFFFAYKIEVFYYEPYFINCLEEKVKSDACVLQYTIYIKDSQNNIWELIFIKDTEHVLENFYLGNRSLKINDISLYQDLDHTIRQNIEQNLLTELYLLNDSRSYSPIQIRNQETSIGAKYGCINFKIHAQLLQKEEMHTTIDIDSPYLYLRADESGEERFVEDSYVLPERLQYGSFEVPSLYTRFENPIHQILNDSLVNQFYSYFSKKNLNTLIFTKSVEVIEDLPICFDLVDEKDFKPDFTQ